MHHYQDIITIFNDCFLEAFNTQLVRGTDEPLYLPASENLKHHTLYFAHGFFSSALHEVSHWLIAGEKRRQLVDFGYWYEPDGRSQDQQLLFQSVEVKPQALEWILSKATNYPFRISLDNLNGQESDSTTFKKALYNQVKVYCEKGLPKRAAIFRESLCHFYHSPLLLKIEDFTIDSLW